MFQKMSEHGSQVYQRFQETICPQLNKGSLAATKTVGITTVVLLLFVFTFVYSVYINPSVAVTVAIGSSKQLDQQSKHLNTSPPSASPPKNRVKYSLNCNITNQTQICPRSLPLVGQEYQSPSSLICPDYFRWIHEDLRPWKETGITEEMLERARKTANFRLVILDGKAYVETYSKAFQTRDVFTLWGILQLLKLYPGKVPDLDLMFDCDDQPVIFSRNYNRKGPNAVVPPPLFRYCGSDKTFDIPFPDWSFWGWPEINIKPWESLLKELNQGNTKLKWIDREPYAYWKGNPHVAQARQDLLQCNISDQHDWNARLYAQDWISEMKKGYKQSNLAEQCIHRYKIYIEGRAWSVSEKYILACNSMTLLVTPHYYDTFTRNLMPMEHYWPIKENEKCKSIKYAVDWGNKNKKKAQKIGKAASNFINTNMSMEYVYDYIFHTLSEYAKLLKFKPSKPEKAVEFCSESMACSADGLVKTYMMDSIVKSPSDTMPCNLPTPMDSGTLKSIIKRKEKSIKQVEMWQKKQ